MAELFMRHTSRFEIVAPVSYWWPSPTGALHSSKGETRNISQRGVLVAAEECPPLGSPVQLTIRLPRLREKGLGMRLEGEGMVVRVQDTSNSHLLGPTQAFAVSVQFYLEKSEQQERRKRSGVEKLTVMVK